MHDGVLRVPAVDMVAAVEEVTTTKAHAIIESMCRPDRSAHVRRMVAKVFTCKAISPGRVHPVWVLDYTQCSRLLASGCLHSEKAEELGDYILEQFILAQPDGYSELIARAVEIGRQQILRKQAKAGYVYAAYSDSNGLKIGMTCRENPMTRIKALNTAVQTPYVLVDFIRCGNPRELEGFVHSLLQPWRVGNHNRELFTLYPTAGCVLFESIRAEMGMTQSDEDEDADIKVLRKKIKVDALYNFQSPRDCQATNNKRRAVGF